LRGQELIDRYHQKLATLSDLQKRFPQMEHSPMIRGSSLNLVNPFRFGIVPTEFASLYESFQDLTVLQKQHFIEWFSGDALDTIWTQTNITGTGTFAMVDAIDEGFSIRTDSIADAMSEINFNNKRHYKHDASIIIMVAKNNRLVSGDNRLGLAGDIGINSPLNTAYVVTHSTGTQNFQLSTKDATTASLQDSSVAPDALFHVFKIECGSVDIKLTIEGVLEVTKTTNRPTAKMQPALFVSTGGAGGVNEGRLRYLEAFNT